MKFFNWNEEKNRQLKEKRRISFEIILLQIEKSRVLDILQHHSKSKYPDQRKLIIEYNNYAWFVQVIENEKEIFMKTIIPGRKATKKYLERS